MERTDTCRPPPASAQTPSPARVCECAATPAPSVRSVTGGAPKPFGPLLASAARLPTCPGRPRRRPALLRPFPPRRAPAPSPTALCPPPPQAGPGPARRHLSRRVRPRGFLPESRPPGTGQARGPGIRAGQPSGAGCGARPDGGAAEPGAAQAARAVRGRALTEEVMRRTAPRSPPDGRSASEPSPSPSLRTATAAQPPPQIASRFPCLLRRRCPLASARARRRGAPWDRWSGRRPPFRSR